MADRVGAYHKKVMSLPGWEESSFQKGTNPREGIETCPVSPRCKCDRYCQKRTNSREGIETRQNCAAMTM